MNVLKSKKYSICFDFKIFFWLTNNNKNNMKFDIFFIMFLFSLKINKFYANFIVLFVF